MTAHDLHERVASPDAIARASPEHPEPAAAPVSVVVLTHNEEANIEPCLASCRWCDDVHVLDSGSADRTQAIARGFGAHVHEHPFTSFGDQRNWAIDNVDAKHEWVFHLDADERFTPELVRELAQTLRRDPAEAGFYCPNKLIFMGRWVRRAAGYPSYQARFFHRDRMRFVDHGHGQREEAAGAIGRLREPYLHHNFSKGLSDWFEKHNRYSALEAEQAMVDREKPLRSVVGGLFSRDLVVRRRAMKALGHRAPMRPALVWAYLMFLKGGVFDGPAGWNYVKLRSTYESMISAKVAALRAARRADEGPRP